MPSHTKWHVLSHTNLWIGTCTHTQNLWIGTCTHTQQDTCFHTHKTPANPHEIRISTGCLARERSLTFFLFNIGWPGAPLRAAPYPDPLSAVGRGGRTEAPSDHERTALSNRHPPTKNRCRWRGGCSQGTQGKRRRLKRSANAASTVRERRPQEYRRASLLVGKAPTFAALSPPSREPCANASKRAVGRFWGFGDT